MKKLLLLLAIALLSSTVNVVQAEDKVNPTVTDGTVTVSEITETSVKLSWNKATDNVTDQSKLKYTYTYALGYNASGFPAENAKSGVDITSGVITGLEAGKKYTVWVYVTDEAGNSNYGYEGTGKYNMVNVTTADKTSPVVSNKTVTISNITASSAYVSWTLASDNITPQNKIRYFASLISGGHFVDGGIPKTENINSYKLTGLTPSTKYEIRLFAFDESDNNTGYTATEFTTGPDAAAQLPDRTVTVGAVTETSIQISWEKASDDVTPQSKLRYKAYCEDQANNWLISSDYLTDLTTYTFTGLDPNTKYTLYARVFDESDNKSDYYSADATTKADTEAPKVPDDQITVVNVTETSIQISWKKAVDNVTPQEKLVYIYTYVLGLGPSGFPTTNETSGVDITSGTITGLQPGTLYQVWVYVRDEAGNESRGIDVSSYEIVKVTTLKSNVAVTGITLNASTLSLEPGNSATLTATVSPANATNPNVTWKSSDESVATVDANGKITAVKAGTASIIATTVDGGKTAICNVTVTLSNVAVTDIKLNASSLSIERGKSATLTATISPANATNPNVTWKSSDELVATVDANGKITAVKIGTASIVATTVDGGKTAICNVTVTSPVANEDVQADQIFANGGTLHILLTMPSPVQIVNITGKLIKAQNLPAGETKISLERGIYIVRTKTLTNKILIR